MAALGILAASGCGSGSTPNASVTSKLDPEGVIHLHHGIPLRCLDPHKAYTVLGDMNLRLVYDYLIVRNTKMELTPGLATSWKFGPQNQYFEMSLRQGVKFQDGTSFDAQAVRANIEREKTLGPGSGASVLSAVSSVTVVDPRTVRLNLSGSGAALLPAALSLSPGAMISPAAFNSDLCQTPVGTGPYKIVNNVTGKEITFERWDGYWDKSAQGAKQFVSTYTGNDDTRLNAMLSRQADVTYLRPFQVEKVQGDTTFKLYSVAMPQFLAVFINNSRPPFNNADVRRALNICVDRQGIIAAVEGGRPKPAIQPWRPGDWEYNTAVPDSVYAHNVAQAKELLKSAGYPSGIQMSLIVQAGLSEFQAVTTAIQGSLAPCGVQVTLSSQLNSLAAWQSGKFDSTYFGWSPVPDPAMTVSTIFLPDGSWNVGGWAPPELVDLAKKGLDTTDQTQRAKIYQQISKIVVDNALFMPIYFDESEMAVNHCVVGWHADTFWTNVDWRGVGMAKGCTR
jgi:peptide/nickel transport system substrate-binding protein